jgi:hypothetical protein
MADKEIDPLVDKKAGYPPKKKIERRAVCKSI